MKKTFAPVLAFFLSFSAPSVFAQMPLAVPVAAAPSLEQIGVVAAIGGKVELTTPGQVGRIAQSGQAVFMGDEVKTDAQGHLQILLLDQTVFTIGPDSTLVIDTFVYDPKTQEGKVQANISKGVFRYVSGKIAAKKPSHVTLKLPTATIGIRGTIVGGNVVPGGNSLVALLGPGANNNAGENPGSFSISGGGGSQTVDHTGFGVTVGPNGGLSGVFQLSDQDINNLTTGLAPSGGGSGSGAGGGSATDQSGQGTVNTGENSGVSNSLSNLGNTNNDASNTAAQDAAANAATIRDGLSTFQDLSKMETGVYHYYGSGSYGTSGSMFFQCDIDFGAKTIGGGNSMVEVNGSAYSDSTGTSGMSGQSYAGKSGDAVFHWPGILGVNGGTFNNIDLALSNSGGVVANQAKVNVNYTQVENSDGPSVSGSGEGSRYPGPSSPRPSSPIT